MNQNNRELTRLIVAAVRILLTAVLAAAVLIVGMILGWKDELSGLSLAFMTIGLLLFIFPAIWYYQLSDKATERYRENIN